jgi:hypothetical protein
VSIRDLRSPATKPSPHPPKLSSHRRAADFKDDDQDDPRYRDLLSGFDNLNLSMEARRFELHRDPLVDEETRRRVQGKLLVALLC